MMLVVIGVYALTLGSERASADTYEVQAGDTLYDIASCLNVNQSVLVALNDLQNPDAIFSGQQLTVPANAENTAAGCRTTTPSESEPAPASSATPEAATIGSGGCSHEVRPGQFLGAIALSYQADTSTLLDLNPGLQPDYIQAGSTLIVPCSEDSAAEDAAPSEPSNANAGNRALTAGAINSTPALLPKRTTEYVVEPGDGLQFIADDHNISLQELLSYNDLAPDALIHPGDVLRIPVPDYLVPALDPSEAWGILTDTYTVRSGDNAGLIADRYGITVRNLSLLNGGRDLNLIQVGERLMVPWTGGAINSPPGTVSAVETRRRSYRVQVGDTFFSIAAQHGLTMDALRELNPSRPNDLVVVDQLLYLPGVIEPPVVSEERTIWETDLTQYAAAALGVTPHTLLANHPWIEPEQWIATGTVFRVPVREGLLVTVRAGDTLLDIADRHGVDMSLILADPAYGVEDPNAIVIGQEIILPLAMPDFVWPVQGELTDPFGQCRSWDCSYRHKGLDIAVDFYAPITAAAGGLVSFVGGDPDFGLGWYVEIEHEGGWSTTYAHLVEFAVYEGQYVGQGDIIGYNGSTGYSTGPHLHFEVRHDDWYIDPLVVLP